MDCFSFAKFVSETVNNSDTRPSHKSDVTVTLGGTVTNRNDPIQIVLPKVAKFSTSVVLSRVVVTIVITLTFTNVNTA